MNEYFFRQKLSGLTETTAIEFNMKKKHKKLIDFIIEYIFYE